MSVKERKPKLRAEITKALDDGNLPGLMELLKPSEEIEVEEFDQLAAMVFVEVAFERPCVHSEREAELEREMEAQAQRYQLQLSECKKRTADRDKLALQVDQLQARLKLLGDAADWAVKLSSDATREVLNVIHNSAEGEIRF